VLQHGGVAPLEALVARIMADHAEAPSDVRRGGWIAEVDGALGERAGCVLCVLCVPGAAADQAVLRILLVTPAARGQHWRLSL
jgi:hypothetical protein